MHSLNNWSRLIHTLKLNNWRKVSSRDKTKYKLTDLTNYGRKSVSMREFARPRIHLHNNYRLSQYKSFASEYIMPEGAFLAPFRSFSSSYFKNLLCLACFEYWRKINIKLYNYIFRAHIYFSQSQSSEGRTRSQRGERTKNVCVRQSK